MKIRAVAARACAAISIALSCGAHAGTAQVSGTIDNADPTDGLRHETFTCFGMPTCVGTHTVTQKPKNCSNTRTGTSDVTFTGLDLSHPGTISGTQVLPNRVFHSPNPDGTCTYTTAPGVTWTFNAGWDGSSGTMTVAATHQDGTPRAEKGNFTANVATQSPVFPMDVTGSVNSTTASASAQIQPRAQDVGTQASVFVFAHAPLSRLKAFKDDGDICVLAQLNGQGQLVPVSASSMQAYTTGVLGAQSQSVSILNNVPTPNVAGATFFVGYGSTATTMLANGVYQSAVTVPGSVQCNANLATAPAPQTPGALSGLWWNAGESGWGLHLTQRGNNTFAAWYTYDGAGKPKWYVSTCSGAGATSGTCSGTLYEVTGPNFFGGGFNPGQVSSVANGSVQLTFANANAATMTYTGVAGQTRTVQLTRQPLATGTAVPIVDYTDIWWNSNESGWGMAMAQQYGITFLAWYVYDSTGKPTWLVATCAMSGSSCSGTLYRTTGPVFGPTFDPTAVHATQAGTVTVNFTDANNAVIDYTVDGVAATKSVTRQLF